MLGVKSLTVLMSRNSLRFESHFLRCDLYNILLLKDHNLITATTNMVAFLRLLLIVTESGLEQLHSFQGNTEIVISWIGTNQDARVLSTTLDGNGDLLRLERANGGISTRSNWGPQHERLT
jgi:hypothetical protein